MDKQEQEERDLVAWNLKAQYSMMVLGQLQTAQTSYSDGEIPKWFYCMSGIRELINHDLTKKEQKDLDKLEKSIHKRIGLWDKYLEAKEDETPLSKEKNKEIGKFCALIKLYQRKVMKLLKELGYFPKKEDMRKVNF